MSEIKCPRSNVPRSNVPRSNENHPIKYDIESTYQNFSGLSEAIEAAKMQSCVPIDVSSFNFRAASLDQEVNQKSGVFRRIYMRIHTGCM